MGLSINLFVLVKEMIQAMSYAFSKLNTIPMEYLSSQVLMRTECRSQLLERLDRERAVTMDHQAELEL